MVVPDLLKVSNLPQNLPCPLPKVCDVYHNFLFYDFKKFQGKYSVKNFVVDESRFRFVPPGKYRTSFVATEGEKILGAIDVNATLKL